MMTATQLLAQHTASFIWRYGAPVLTMIGATYLGNTLYALGKKGLSSTPPSASPPKSSWFSKLFGPVKSLVKYGAQGVMYQKFLAPGINHILKPLTTTAVHLMAPTIEKILEKSLNALGMQITLLAKPAAPPSSSMFQSLVNWVYPSASSPSAYGMSGTLESHYPGLEAHAQTAGHWIADHLESLAQTSHHLLTHTHWDLKERAWALMDTAQAGLSSTWHQTAPFYQQCLDRAQYGVVQGLHFSAKATQFALEHTCATLKWGLDEVAKETGVSPILVYAGAAGMSALMLYGGYRAYVYHTAINDHPNKATGVVAQKAGRSFNKRPKPIMTQFEQLDTPSKQGLLPSVHPTLKIRKRG